MGASRDLLNLGSRFLQASKIFASVSPNRSLFREKVDAGLQALLLKKPCNYKPVAAVISFAAKNGGSACGCVIVISAKELKELRSRVFHELKAGNAVALGGEAVHFAHFGSSESFHERFMELSEHPAAADIDDLSSNIFRLFGSEKSDGGCDVFDCRRTADRKPGVADAASLFQ